jgi:hypothetical protein
VVAALKIAYPEIVSNEEQHPGNEEAESNRTVSRLVIIRGLPNSPGMDV